MTLKELHEKLQLMFEELGALRKDPVLYETGTDTVFALGEVMGVLSKAKALVGRDIDDSAT